MSKYDSWPKEKLIAEIKRLKKTTYGLIWDDKPEDVAILCKEKLPVLVDVPNQEISSDDNKPVNILIEGDNYHALSVLNFTHNRAIDVIYIDPPFNTGSRSWKYNNDYVEKDDHWAHSKWLSMMSKRLVLAKKLLKPRGALIVAIDDYEVNQLGLLLEKIFADYERDLIIVEHHPQGAGSDTVSRVHEYAYVCTPKGIGFDGRKIRDEEGKWSLKRSGQGENNWRINRPKQFFAIIVDEVKRLVVGVGPEIPRDQKKYPSGNTSEGYLRIYPIDRENKERVWRYNRETMSKLIESGNIEYTKKGSLTIKKTSVNAVPVFSIWRGARYNAGTNGSSLLTQIMGKANMFPYPKSLYAVVDMLQMIIGNNKEAIVLDFFAGSGTTGHAVLELNKDDDGNRQFILCTNNENKIAEEVCYPRIKKVITGYKDSKGEKVQGFGGNLKYFRTDFVDAEPTDKNKKKLTEQATEMLCLKEGTFEKITSKKAFKIYKNTNHYTGIIFDQMAIPDFKEAIAKLKGKFSVYVFSLGDDSFDEEFDDVKQRVKLSPIPEVILRVYRRIFK
jgi:adenine-specific DNA-methyltransferase